MRQSACLVVNSITVVAVNIFKPSSIFYRPFQGGASFVDPFRYLCFVIVLSVSCSRVITWREWADQPDLLALLRLMFTCVFVTVHYGVLCQVRYLIVSITDFCLRPYFFFNAVCSL